MKTINTEIKVGFFVLLATVVLAYMTLKINKELPFFRPKKGYSLNIYFDSISGVEKKSSVRMAGVKIGRVTDIGLEEGRARVIIQISEKIRIHKDATARIRSHGLLGEKYIEISGGSKDQPLLKEGEVLVSSRQPADIDEMVSKFAVVLNDIRSVTRSLSHILGTSEGEEGLRQIFDNIKSITNNVNKFVLMSEDKLKDILNEISRLIQKFSSISSDLHSMIKDNKESLENSLKNFEGFSARLKKDTPELVAELKKAINKINEILEENQTDFRETLINTRESSAKLKSILDSGQKLIDSFKETSESIQSTAASINDLTLKVEKGQGTVGKLLTEEEVYDKLNSTLSGVNKLTSRMDSFKIYSGFRGEQQIDEGESKGYFTLKLKSREDRYYLLEVTEDVRKGRKQKNNNALANLRYTFLFGKRYNQLGLKIGIMESSFGMGLDYYFLRDRLRITLDAFNLEGYDQQLSPNPQIKLTTRYYLYKYVFLEGGLDEALNKNYRTFLAGLGIRFADEDLKYLLGAIRLR